MKRNRREESFYSSILAITNRHLGTRPYVEQIERICARQPLAVLVREKDLLEEEYAGMLMQVKRICDAYQVRCIAHTYFHAARQCGMKDVHLPLAVCRAAGREKAGFQAIGVSVHSAEQAREAEKAGASYLTAGHVLATPCKAGIAPRGKDFLKEVCGAVEIPVYAVGGMADNERCLEEMKGCGAAGIAVMSACMAW